MSSLGNGHTALIDSFVDHGFRIEGKRKKGNIYSVGKKGNGKLGNPVNFRVYIHAMNSLYGRTDRNRCKKSNGVHIPANTQCYDNASVFGSHEKPRLL